MYLKRCVVVTGKWESHRTYEYDSTTVHYRIKANIIPRCSRCCDLHSYLWQITSTVRGAFGGALAAGITWMFWANGQRTDLEPFTYVVLGGAFALLLGPAGVLARWIETMLETPHGERLYWNAKKAKQYEEMSSEGCAMTLDYRQERLPIAGGVAAELGFVVTAGRRQREIGTYVRPTHARRLDQTPGPRQLQPRNTRARPVRAGARRTPVDRAGFEVLLDEENRSPNTVVDDDSQERARDRRHFLFIVIRAWLERAGSKLESNPTVGQPVQMQRHLAVRRESIDERLLAARLPGLPTGEWLPDDPEPDARFWEVFCGLTQTHAGDRREWAENGRTLFEGRLRTLPDPFVNGEPDTSATASCPSRPVLALPAQGGIFLLTDSGACFSLSRGKVLSLKPLPDLDGCSALVVDGAGQTPHRALRRHDCHPSRRRVGLRPGRRRRPEPGRSNWGPHDRRCVRLRHLPQPPWPSNCQGGAGRGYRRARGDRRRDRGPRSPGRALAARTAARRSHFLGADQHE